MKRLGAVAFGAAFVTSVLVAGPSCVYDNECKCKPIPPRPDAQGLLTGLEVSSYDARGNDANSLVLPENGTVQVTPTELVFAYEQEGVSHQIVYTVIPTP